MFHRSKGLVLVSLVTASMALLSPRTLLAHGGASAGGHGGGPAGAHSAPGYSGSAVHAMGGAHPGGFGRDSSVPGYAHGFMNDRGTGGNFVPGNHTMGSRPNRNTVAPPPDTGSGSTTRKRLPRQIAPNGSTGSAAGASSSRSAEIGAGGNSTIRRRRRRRRTSRGGTRTSRTATIGIPITARPTFTVAITMHSPFRRALRGRRTTPALPTPVRIFTPAVTCRPWWTPIGPSARCPTIPTFTPFTRWSVSRWETTTGRRPSRTRSSKRALVGIGRLCNRSIPAPTSTPRTSKRWNSTSTHTKPIRHRDFCWRTNI